MRDRHSGFLILNKLRLKLCQAQVRLRLRLRLGLRFGVEVEGAVKVGIEVFEL